jgi:pyridoxamine 5'-phosphate oxidase
VTEPPVDREPPGLREQALEPSLEASLDLASRREAYTAGELLEDQLLAHPLAQFELWIRAALAAGRAGGVPEPNAMVLSTVGEGRSSDEGAGGAPSTRTVLLKGLDGRGFVFFTNYTSRKGGQIEQNPRVALCFPWYGIRRQVNVRGVASRVPAEESAAYFGTRPWESRIGAWASRQSRPAAGRAELDEAWTATARRWPDRGRPDDVPLPPFWGGFVVAATEVEFWQGRSGRLHDRLAYVSVTGGPGRLDVPSDWRVERRQP